MNKSFFIVAGTIMIVIASLWVTSCEQENPEVQFLDETVVEDRGSSDLKVFLPNDNPYGKPYVDWTVLWMQKFMSFNCFNSPFVNPLNPLFSHEGPVWFLAGLPKEGASAKITVPRGKAILFPLANFINGYPCLGQDFEPAPGQSLEAFLQQGALNAFEDAPELSVEIDGVPVNRPNAYQFTSGLFTFTGNPEFANCFDACVTGKPQKAVTSGFYMMVKPLTKGLHILHYQAAFPALNTVQDGTYYIEVTELDNLLTKNRKPAASLTAGN